jgi:hypothetical protein
VNRTNLLFLSLALMMLAACTHDIRVDTDFGVKQSPKPDFSPPLNGPFNRAETWIQSLNQQGVPCRRITLEHPPPPPKLIRDVGYCRLDNGDTMTVWIVDNAKQTYDNLGRHGPPQYILYHANWLAFLPTTAPTNTVSTIRQSFHAAG